MHYKLNNPNKMILNITMLSCLIWYFIDPNIELLFTKIHLTLTALLILNKFKTKLNN